MYSTTLDHASQYANPNNMKTATLEVHISMLHSENPNFAAYRNDA